MPVSVFTTRKGNITVEEKGITALLEEIEFYAAFIDTKVINAIKETENLLQHILAVLGMQ